MATTQRSSLDVAREVSAEIAIDAGDRDVKRLYPSEQLRVVRDSGLEALIVPTHFGGPGASLAEALDVTAALAEGDPNIAHMYGNIHLFGIVAASNLASPAVAERLNRRAVDKQLRWGNAFSEIRTKNAFHYSVKLERRSHQWQLHGEKFYSTGSVGADWLFVLANIAGTEDMRVCLVPGDAPGLEIVDDWSGMGQATTGSGTTRFVGVPVSDDCVLDPAPLLSPVSLASVVALAAFSAVHLGIVRNAVRDASSFVAERARPSPFSGVDRAAADPFVLRNIGVMRTQLAACEGLHRRMLEAIDEAVADVDVPLGHVPCIAASPESRARAAVAVYEAKSFIGEVGLKVCEMLFQVGGASSTLRKYNYDRHWRNLRTVTLHDAVDYKYLLIGDYYLNGALPPVTAHS